MGVGWTGGSAVVGGCEYVCKGGGAECPDDGWMCLVRTRKLDSIDSRLYPGFGRVPRQRQRPDGLARSHRGQPLFKVSLGQDRTVFDPLSLINPFD